MNLIIELYILICAALLAFDLIFLFIKGRGTRLLYPKNNKFELKLRYEIQMQEGQQFSPEFRARTEKSLKKVQNLITLVSLIQDREDLKRRFSGIIYDCAEVYCRKKPAEQAYYAYVISLLDYHPEDIPLGFQGRLMSLLDTDSIYTFSNTMNALYHFGQPMLLLEALNKVDQRGEFYHRKLLIDGLLASKADFSVLNPMIEQRFSGYHPYLQSALLDFFRMNGWDAAELCLGLLEDSAADEEVRYTAMRYFAKYPCHKSEKFFLETLKSGTGSWVQQMLAIQGLDRCSHPEVRKVITGKITSRDWYVRVNAAKYLYRHDLTREEINTILQMGDRYAEEILRYCCQENQELAGYIDRTASELRAQKQNNRQSEESDSADGKEKQLAGLGL